MSSAVVQSTEHKRDHEFSCNIRSEKFPYLFQTPNVIEAGLSDCTDVVLHQEQVNKTN